MRRGSIRLSSIDTRGQAAHGDAAQLEKIRPVVDHQHDLPILQGRGGIAPLQAGRRFDRG